MKFKILVMLLAYMNFPVQAPRPDIQDLLDYILYEYEADVSALCYNVTEAELAYHADPYNPTNEERARTTAVKMSDWNLMTWYYKLDQARGYIPTHRLDRQLDRLYILGHYRLDKDHVDKLLRYRHNLELIYLNAKICPYPNQQCNHTKEGYSLPGIEKTISNSRNLEKLTYVWTAWRNATGYAMKKKGIYKEYVDLSIAEAQTKFSDYPNYRSNYWDFFYGKNFIQIMDALWSEVKPLYQELHKFVGRKLKMIYGKDLDVADGLIPAHVFGDLWAQNWENLAKLVSPTKYDTDMTLDKNLVRLHLRPEDLFIRVALFYQLLGLQYSNTSNVRVELTNHPGVFDFCNGEDYVLEMCAELSFKCLKKMCNGLGQILYLTEYADQPYIFRAGANPAFMEAIGHSVALSMTSPDHQIKMNLVTESLIEGYGEKINFLLKMALQKVASLPFNFLVDKWRYDVFTGRVPESKWNSHWWKNRAKYQGVKPPVERSDGNDFDPGSAYHVIGDSKHISYFLANILEFQIYGSLCETVGQYNPRNPTTSPLYNCNFYNESDAGDVLRAAMRLGASKPWTETLELLTGSKKISAKPLMAYFNPLYGFLKEENKKYDRFLRLLMKPRKYIRDISVLFLNIDGN